MTARLDEVFPAPVERYGKKWELTVPALAQVQASIPIDKKFMPFVDLFDLFQYGCSPQGCQSVLRAAGDQVDARWLDEHIPGGDQIALASELMIKYLGPGFKAVTAAAANGGDNGSSNSNNTQKEQNRPLSAETSEIGA